jgi:hypothetical protein
MTGRSAKILLSILCGAMLLIAGCTTPAPSAGVTPAPTQITSGASAGAPSAVSGADQGTVVSLLRSIEDQLAVIASNTRSEGRGYVTGNMILFDDQGDPSNTINNGSALIALPGESCDIAIYAGGISTYVTIEEVNNQIAYDFARNRQTCLDVVICRKTVNFDDVYRYLWVYYKPYNTEKTFSQVSLSYRCP